VIDSRRSVGLSLLAGMVVLAVVGCATSGWPKFIGHDDLKSLAGAWQGALVGRTGGLLPMMVVVNADGTYVTTAEAYSSRGTARVADGNLLLRSGETTAGQTPERTSAATLSQRDDGTFVLTGSGRSDAGPFSFVVTKTK